MQVVRAALVLLVTTGPAFGQATASAPQDPKAQAQYEFMMARRLEATGDNAGALASLERARTLDPQAAEIPAEIAGYYYRQNRLTDAVAAAEQALKLDNANVEAHNVLGTVFSAWTDGGTAPPAGQTQASIRASAIEHLTAIQNTPHSAALGLWGRRW